MEKQAKALHGSDAGLKADESPSLPEPKVAIVAVASKESAYIAEWIFHHLRFGFDPIVVLVNRCDETTYEMVQKISKTDDRVRAINVDFLDGDLPLSNQTIQPDAYEFGLETLRQDLSPNSYMVCLDIDEFWTPTDFQTSISGYLENCDWPKKFSFNWFLLTDEPHVFRPPYRASNGGEHNVHLKAGFQLGLPVTKIFAHHVVETEKLPVRLGTGQDLAANMPRSTEVQQDFGDAFVLHRKNRSEVEYIGLLGRTNLELAEALFKANRKGFGWNGRFETHFQDFRVAPALLEAYYTDFEAFLSEHGLKDLAHAGREKMLDRHQAVLALYASLPADEKQKWAHAFEKLDLDSLPDKLEKARQELAVFGGGLRPEGL
jgi:hypothetical protein